MELQQLLFLSFVCLNIGTGEHVIVKKSGTIRARDRNYTLIHYSLQRQNHLEFGVGTVHTSYLSCLLSTDPFVLFLLGLVLSVAMGNGLLSCQV